jgi:hypothetical protein
VIPVNLIDRTDSLTAKVNLNLNFETLRDMLMNAATFMWKAGKQNAGETTMNVVDDEEVESANYIGPGNVLHSERVL